MFVGGVFLQQVGELRHINFDVCFLIELNGLSVGQQPGRGIFCICQYLPQLIERLSQIGLR